MFGRGSRFPPEKASDVPGPGAYDPEDPKYDTYKRVPGPGTYNVTSRNTDGKPTGRDPSGDKYAILQRKLENLERVHEDSKREHQAEQERLKQELARTQRINSETNDQLEKLKRQNDAQDARIQELKKSNLSDQLEIKDLRVKLRMMEHEKAQLSSKQGEVSETKKALYTLETKRREELRERDRRIAELEKSLTAERDKRESAETKMVKTRGEISSELQEARLESRTLRNELREAKSETEKVEAALVVLKTESEDTEEELLEQLDNYKALLSRVAQEYGRLASTTVSKATHERVKHESLAVHLRVNKLERKLANTECQVTELAHFVRHTQEQNTLLFAQLRDGEEQLAYYASALRHSFTQVATVTRDDLELAQELWDAGRTFKDAETERRIVEQRDNSLWTEFDALRRDQLHLHAALLLKRVDEAQDIADKRNNEVNAARKQSSRLSSELSALREELEATKTQLIDTSSSLDVCRATEESLRKQLEGAFLENKIEVAKAQKLVKHEKEATQRLAGLVTQGKAIEESLTEEIDHLTADLTEAERYREAYHNMIDEVDALVRKNALAEDEAAKLSKFNAQILGHNNPQQRIMYVDKIRQELHGVKQTLLMTTKDKEAVISENEELRCELELYKSVGVPAEVKPRTFVTRVSRAPLASHNLNTSTNTRSGSKPVRRPASRYESEHQGGDMLLNELDA
ncbi:hypothetical protein BDY19DRAFT_460717 [Irpex rosettiformis]|uniref:Uncharacterized protein n=1 Tax=Irpex rosettiformis TaxID=378272 RepID=A0ACB8TTD4_9APHY|nr:hypothetical protein BDY19DRAFT_460717 [Irpex rosettiformis]